MRMATQSPNRKMEKKNVISYTKSEVISIMIWAVKWSGVVVIQKSTEWTGIRNWPREDIFHAPICKLLKIIHLLYDNLIQSSWKTMILFIKQMSLKIDLMRMVLLLLTGPHTHPIWMLYEQGWAKLKDRIYRFCSDFKGFDWTKRKTKRAIYNTTEEAWESLDDGCFDPLIRSMESRVNAMLEAKGWYACCRFQIKKYYLYAIQLSQNWDVLFNKLVTNCFAWGYVAPIWI